MQVSLFFAALLLGIYLFLTASPGTPRVFLGIWIFSCFARACLECAIYVQQMRRRRAYRRQPKYRGER